MTTVYRPGMELPCDKYNAAWAFDQISDRTAGPAFDEAREYVGNLCGTCPIRDACHQANDGEDWLKALKRERDKCPLCGAEFAQTKCGPPRRYCGVKCRRASEYMRRKAAA